MFKLIWPVFFIMYAFSEREVYDKKISDKLSYNDIIKNKKSSNIKEIILLAYLNNPIIKAALAKKRSKDEDVALAFSEFYPSIYAKYSYGFSKNKKDKNLSNIHFFSRNRISEQNTSSSIALAYEQNIFGANSIEKVRQMKFESESARFSFYNTVQQVIQYTSESFVNLWAAYEIFKSYYLMEQNLKQVLISYTAQLKAGTLKIQDLESIRSSHAESVFKKISSLAEIQSQIATLKRFICSNSDILPILSDIFYDLPKTKKELIECIENENPSVISAKNIHLAKEQEAIVITNGITYSIDLKAQLARNLKHKQKNKNYEFGISRDTVMNSLKNDTSYINLVLTVPLSPNESGNNGYSKVRKVQEETIQAYFDYIDTLNKAKKDAINEWNNFNAATKQIYSSKIAVESAEIAEDGYKKEELIGTRSSTEVVYSENKLLERRIQYIDAVRKRAITAIRLNAYLGRLSPRHLHVNVPSYNLKYGQKIVERAPFKTSNPVYNLK